MSEVHTKNRPLCGGEIIPKYLGFFFFCQVRPYDPRVYCILML